MGWFHTQDGVLYNCSDTESLLFAQGHTQSQAMLPFGSNVKYARWTTYYVVAIISVIIGRRIADHIVDSRYRHGNSKGGIPIIGRLVSIGRFVGYRRLPSTVHRLTCLPSSVGACIMLGTGFLYMLLICFIPRFYYRECFGFGSPPLAIRAGLMANALTPFIYTFSGKTNIISALTGVSYDKIQVYHAGLAWGSFFFAWVHAIPFFVQLVREGGASWLRVQFNDSPEYLSGAVTIVALAILSFCSLKAFRNRFYELFLHIHWPTGIAYLGLLFWHDEEELESWMYLWGALAAYASGLCYRYLQKTSYLQLRGEWFKTEEATLRVLSDEAVEVTVFTPAIKPWKPGQHLFIRFVSVQPLGNHPFTIASLPERSEGHAGTLKIRLIARPCTGFTRMLYAAAEQNSESSYRVVLDGPYGGIDRDICSFDDVILCCSGSGATAIFPFLSYLAQASQVFTIAVKRIRLLWSIRHLDAYDWFRDDIEQAVELLKGTIEVEILVHVSQSQSTAPGSPSLAEKTLSTEVTDHPSVETPSATFKPGRASIHQQLNSWSEKFENRAIVITAGCDGVRNEVCSAVANLQTRVLTGAQKEIYLHTESFGW